VAGKKMLSVQMMGLRWDSCGNAFVGSWILARNRRIEGIIFVLLLQFFCSDKLLNECGVYFSDILSDGWAFEWLSITLAP
jgi:hypothetical protein